MPVTRFEKPDPDERARRIREGIGGGMSHRPSDEHLIDHVSDVIGYDPIEKRREEIVETEANQDESPSLSYDEIWQELDSLAHERLGMSADEFVAKWRSGGLDPGSGTEARLAILARLVEQ
jgi:hypothetical protein